MKLITKLYNDLTYWKKSTYENLRSYDCSNSDVFYENDSSSSLSLPDDFFSDDDDIYNELLDSPDSAQAPKPEHSDDDDNKSNSSFVIFKRKAKRKKRPRGASQFILDQADDDEYGTDNDEDELLNSQSVDRSLLNFIDDDEENEEYDEDAHINYMRSVTDVVNVQGQYKLKYDFDPNIEVYSQFPSTQEIEEDEYDKDDSFICEEIVYSNTQPAPVNISSPRRLRSRKVLKSNKRKESTPIVEKPKKRYRRIIIESP